MGAGTVRLCNIALLAALVCAADPRQDRFFRARDANGDGKLSVEEFPPGGQQFFRRIDRDGDGFVTKEEDSVFREERARARGAGQGAPAGGQRIEPTAANVAYGPHERNVLDFWQAGSDTPAPVLVFFHGGGFRNGSKEGVNGRLLKLCLDGGISFAAANYRLSGQAPYPAQMHDSARAIQTLRHRAAEWNIDPDRIAAYGGSAGAGISLWLGLHDDLADPASEDPVARLSSRLTCAIGLQAQCTYDPREIRAIVPGRAYNDGAL